MSSVTRALTRNSAWATPGIALIRSSRYSGARFKETKTSGEPIAVVVSGLCQSERFERTHVHDVDAHRGRNDQADGQHLSFDAPEIPDEFAVDGLHQTFTSGVPKATACFHFAARS